MQISPPTLESVVEQFNVWRTNKNGPCKTPQNLWEAAKQLVGRYKTSHIIRALHISSEQYQRHIANNATAAHISNIKTTEGVPVPAQKIDFLKIPTLPIPPIAGTNLSILRQDAAQLNLTIHDEMLLLKIIREFTGVSC